jgi:molybdenum cofactor cytidylyltransferase
VLPGDMPLVQSATLLAVANALDHHPVAYAQHRGRRGHPVGFGAELYSELVTLSGDEGCAAPGRAVSGAWGRCR